MFSSSSWKYHLTYNWPPNAMVSTSGFQIDIQMYGSVLYFTDTIRYLIVFISLTLTSHEHHRHIEGRGLMCSHHAHHLKSGVVWSFLDRIWCAFLGDDPGVKSSIKIPPVILLNDIPVFIKLLFTIVHEMVTISSQNLRGKKPWVFEPNE